MRPDLTIVHASDIHLDTDFHEGGHDTAARDRYRAVFERLLAQLRGHDPHLFLLPGDLFDSNRASADTIHWARTRLAELPFPVAMIPGNHDCLDAEGIFRRVDFEAEGNVAMLLDPAGERRELPRLRVSLWGRGMETHEPAFQPLAGLPAPRPGWWNLGLGHGIYAGGPENGYRSSPVFAEQIAGSGYDYIALGHHHARLDVSEPGTAAHYCGAPVPITTQGRGTYLTVRLREGRPAEVTVHTLE